MKIAMDNESRFEKPGAWMQDQETGKFKDYGSHFNYTDDGYKTGLSYKN